MRIIAGQHRGRTLLPPKDDLTTRPITDRVKENLFNRLHSLGALGYGRVLDIFCGTGSMGLEALSRGAENCIFIDQDRDAIDRLNQNLDALGIGPDVADVRHHSAYSPVWTLPIPDGSLTIIFLDPPYAATLPDGDPDALHRLLTTLQPKLEPGGVAVYRTPPDAVANELPGYDGPFTANYGRMSLHFYQSPLPEDSES